MQQLVESNKRQNALQEQQIQAQEKLLKMKQESNKHKISKHTSDFIKNVFTEDGKNPCVNTPPLIKELMLTSAEATAINLDLVLNKEKTPGKPLIGFIKSFHKGQYYYESGKPGGFTPMAIPLTKHGSGQENINIPQLLAAEENKDDMSVDEKKFLTSNSISPPRTMNYCLKMVQAFDPVLKWATKLPFHTKQQLIYQNGLKNMNTY